MQSQNNLNPVDNNKSIQSEIDITTPLLFKELTEERKQIIALVKKYQQHPKTKEDAEILLELSKLLWNIEDYFDARAIEEEKEKENLANKSRFSGFGILHTVTTGLTAIATGASEIFYISPILTALKNNIHNVTDTSSKLLSNYTQAVTSITNQFASTDVPGVQQLCSQIDPNPTTDNSIYPNIITTFVNGHCKQIFENYISLKIQLRQSWEETFDNLYYRFGPCHSDIWRIINPNHDRWIYTYPYQYFDYNCSDTSNSNRFPEPECQNYLDNFCKSISPYPSVNSLPAFYDSTYGNAYVNGTVNGTCSSVYSAEQLFNCSIGQYANNISQSLCETITSNYCNLTAEVMQQNQTLTGQLNTLHDSNNKNTLISNILIGVATCSALLASSYVLAKIYYKREYNTILNSEQNTLDDSLFKDHISAIKPALDDLIIFLKQKTDKDNVNLNNLLTLLDQAKTKKNKLKIKELPTLLNTLSKNAEYYAAILPIKSFEYNKGLSLFEHEEKGNAVNDTLISNLDSGITNVT